MDQLDAACRTVDLRAKLVASGVKGNIGHVLSGALAAQQQSVPDETEWSDLLDSFFVAGKQLDDLYAEITPMFALAIPTPKKPLAPPSIYTLPQLLSTTVAQEDVEKIRIPAAPGTAALEDQTRDALSNHNAAIETIVSGFNSQIDAWKRDSRKKEQAAAETRKRALRIEEEERDRMLKKIAINK